MMIAKKPSSHSSFLFSYTTNITTTSTNNSIVLKTTHSNSPFTTPTHNHLSLCFSLVDTLLNRGKISAAQAVFDLIINTHSSSLSDTISTLNFATLRCLNLNSHAHASLLQNYVTLGQPHIAETLYNAAFLRRGIVPIPSILESMILCYCRLLKLNEAIEYMDRLLSCIGFSPCKTICNVILSELCTHERVLDAYRLLNRMGFCLSFRCYSLMIDELCIKGNLNEALNVFDEMISFGVRPTSHLYRTLVFNLCKKGDIDVAERLCNEMESCGLVPNKVVYTSLINGYCKEGKIGRAYGVFERMLEMGVERDVYSYNTMLHGLFRYGECDSGWNSVWSLYKEMVGSGLRPNVVTCSIMISSCCKYQKVDCALDFLNHMPSCNLIPSVHCYTSLISALSKENRFKKANELLYKMLDNRVAPDHVMYLNLIKQLWKGQELSLAILILQAVAKCVQDIVVSLFSSSSAPRQNKALEEDMELLFAGIIENNDIPANEIFGILVSALCLEHKTDIARHFMAKMIGHGCKPSVPTYNSLIRCLCQEGRVEDAKDLLASMQGQGMVPNRATYLVMISEHCKQGDMLSAFEFLDDMYERRLQPSVAIYDSIIGALCRENKLDEAKSMFRGMLEVGVAPDEVVFTTLINGYSKGGRANDACPFFDEMLKCGIRPSSHAYAALINGLIKENMTVEGCSYLRNMLENGLEPDVVLFTVLINQFCSIGEVSLAYSLVSLMEKQVEPDLIAYTAFFSGVWKNIANTGKIYPGFDKSMEEARDKIFLLLHRSPVSLENEWKISCESSEDIIKFVQKLMRDFNKRPKVLLDLYHYNVAINGYCRVQTHQRMQDAYEQLELMRKVGLDPNQVTYTILIDGHLGLREIDKAVQIFNDMNTVGCAPDEITYITLIKGLCWSGRLDAALSLLFTMNKKGLFPSKVYERLLKSFCNNRSSALAFNIFEEMLLHGHVPSENDYNRLLGLLSVDNNLFSVQEMIDQRGNAPIQGVKGLLVEACFKQRQRYGLYA